MIDEFKTEGYQRHNRCRQEHLASLNLPLEGKTVLELGAGVGDHTQFFLDRGCEIVCVEGREENAQRIRARFPDVTIQPFDLHFLPACEPYDIVYAYGILYHLAFPHRALKEWAGVCKELLLLETCVSRGETWSCHRVVEDMTNRTAGLNGQGCRPTRFWVYCQLKRYFNFVYLPLTQPDHEEFPLDWNNIQTEGLTRAVFVASHHPLDNPLLSGEIPMIQRRMPCE